MTINRRVFHDKIRSTIFGGATPQTAVETIDAVFDEWEKRKLIDLRWLAYIFATIVIEVGRKMATVREGFVATDAQARQYIKSRGYPYAVIVNGQMYYGRGYVQLTWATNYNKMGEILGIDLLNNPDFALIPQYATQIMFEGMIRGTFTGVSLLTFFNQNAENWREARKIINGMDRADEAANYARQFYAALLSATGGQTEAQKPPVSKPTGKVNFIFFGGLGGDVFSTGGKEMVEKARKMPWVDWTMFYHYEEAEAVIARAYKGWSDPTYIGAHSYGLNNVLVALRKTPLKVPGLLAIDSSQYWYGGGPGYVPQTVLEVDNYYQTSWVPFAIKGSPLYRESGSTAGITNTKVRARHTQMTHLQVVQDAFVKMMNGAKPK